MLAFFSFGEVEELLTDFTFLFINELFLQPFFGIFGPHPLLERRRVSVRHGAASGIPLGPLRIQQ